MHAELKRVDSEWPGKELCFSINDNYVVTCNHVQGASSQLLHVENVNLVTRKK